MNPRIHVPNATTEPDTQVGSPPDGTHPPVNSNVSGSQQHFSVTLADRVFILHEGQNVIGRGRNVRVRLDSSVVSREHARITLCGPEAVIEDLGSKNGTYLGAQRVEAPTRILDQTSIRVGTVWLFFRAPVRGESMND